MPEISVVVPVYNAEKYLRQCIESIMRQTLKDIEIILIDDGSKDTSGAICEEYAKRDKRIKIIHQENQGQSIARNQGIKIATGKWFIGVDADDWCDLDYLETLWKEAENENNIDVVIANCKQIIVGGGRSLLV